MEEGRPLCTKGPQVGGLPALDLGSPPPSISSGSPPGKGAGAGPGASSAGRAGRGPPGGRLGGGVLPGNRHCKSPAPSVPGPGADPIPCTPPAPRSERCTSARRGPLPLGWPDVSPAPLLPRTRARGWGEGAVTGERKARASPTRPARAGSAAPPPARRPPTPQLAH